MTICIDSSPGHALAWHWYLKYWGLNIVPHTKRFMVIDEVTGVFAALYLLLVFGTLEHFFCWQ